MLPKELNYKMPAEWATHQRTFISWPVRQSMCYPEDYEKVCRGYREIILAISEFEPVTVIVNPEDSENVQETISTPNMELLAIEHNDAWLRDNGPTFVMDPSGHVAGVNWRFNAWGEKYSPWDLDDQVASKILDHYQIKCFDAHLIMEGGSIHVDVEGTLLTTEQCLHPNRNRELSREEIERHLENYVNVKKVIWLKSGLFGDETDGHIDNIAVLLLQERSFSRFARTRRMITLRLRRKI
jgi:agmatine deiminase